MTSSDWQYIIDVFNDADGYEAGIEAAKPIIEEAYQSAYESLEAVDRAPTYEPDISFDPTRTGATADTERVQDDGGYGDQYEASITIGKPKTRPTGEDGVDEPVSLSGALQHELHHLYVREELGKQDDWKDHAYAQIADVPVLDQGTDEAFSELLTYCVESDQVTQDGAHDYIETMTERYKEAAGQSTAQAFNQTATEIADRLPEEGDGIDQYVEASSFVDRLISDASHPTEDDA